MPDRRKAGIDGMAGMDAGRVDYTIFFRRLCDRAGASDPNPLRGSFQDREAWDSWFAKYRQRLRTLAYAG